MSTLPQLSPAELTARRDQLTARYQDFQARNLTLDMTRGKPCPEQLDLSMALLEGPGRDYLAEGNIDCRNYGGLEGIPEARRLFAAYLEVRPDEIMVGDSSSLKMMHDTILGAMVHGTAPDAPAWGKLPKVKFLCPSPGYDRHFAVCQYLGIEMIAVAMDESGPDMDRVEELAAGDEAIKGIWCVPKYSNPTGITYSDRVVERLAAMRTAAADFRIFCDNAYAVHDLTGQPDRLKNVLAACREAGNPERVLLFGSTSKITLAGAGIAMLAASRRNLDFIRGKMENQTIGPNKLNQLNHVRFLKDLDGIAAHMRKHAAILKPKFDVVLDTLKRDLGRAGIATWSNPRGGYFVNIDTLEGCARAVVSMAAQAGVKLTPAGATFPYGQDPLDRNIRIAPSYPSVDELATAMELVTICIQLAGIDKLLEG